MDLSQRVSARRSIEDLQASRYVEPDRLTGKETAHVSHEGIDGGLRCVGVLQENLRLRSADQRQSLVAEECSRT
jgi:hypothetical protein